MQWVAPSQKDIDNHALEKRLWEAADQLRANSGLTSAQYSTPVLGLIFLRFAETRFAKRRAELERTGTSGRRGSSRIDEPSAYHAEGVIYLTPNARSELIYGMIASDLYSESYLVEQPAIELFADLGWTAVSAADEILGAAGTLVRETKSEVVLISKLRAVLRRLNPDLPGEAIESAITELARDRSAMSLAAANREIWDLLRDGVTVSVADRERGGQKTERVRVVDWDNPLNNDFLLVSQMTITGELYTCRPDLIGFVNGLPRLLYGGGDAGIWSKGQEQLLAFMKNARFT